MSVPWTSKKNSLTRQNRRKRCVTQYIAMRPWRCLMARIFGQRRPITRCVRTTVNTTNAIDSLHPTTPSFYIHDAVVAVQVSLQYASPIDADWVSAPQTNNLRNSKSSPHCTLVDAMCWTRYIAMRPSNSRRPPMQPASMVAASINSGSTANSST